MAGLMQVVTLAGIVGAIATDALVGWLHGFWPVAVIRTPDIGRSFYAGVEWGLTS
jgi:hypothetical protein